MWSLNVNLKGDLDQDLWAYPLNSGPSPKALMDCGNNIYESFQERETKGWNPCFIQRSAGGLPPPCLFLCFLIALGENFRSGFSLFSFIGNTLRSTRQGLSSISSQCFVFFFNIILFTHLCFWLRWVLRPGLSLVVGSRGLLLSSDAQASHCSGCSCCTHGPRSPGSGAAACGPRCS